MGKIYDCFNFFNELDLLELRMEILKDHVDKFVIVESTVTFSGKIKKLFYDENKDRFKKFHDKIIHIIVDDTPEDFFNLPFLETPKNKKEEIKNKILTFLNSSEGWGRHEKQWGREIYQRESIFYGLMDQNEDDIILISDLDEIPNPTELDKIKNSIGNDVFDFKQNTYYYYFNLLKERNWSGPKCLLWKNLKDTSMNLVRQNKHTTKVISNGGWHFSFMGGSESIKTKIDAYSHQEYNNQTILSNVENNIESENDPFFRGKLFKVLIDETYPSEITENMNKYEKFIKN
jgi:beta-1,4-mannosyl-glycoprotein beta-1,4-N-acetylglucosaminyltransferase